MSVLKWHWFLKWGLATFGTFLFATPALPAERQVLRDQIPAAVAGLTAVDRLPATEQLHLAIGLPLRNRALLTNLLHDLYNPASPGYHHFLKPNQFTASFGPTEADYQALIQFAKTNGFTVTGTHSNLSVLDVTALVADVEKAFHVNMRMYPHPIEHRNFYAPDSDPALDLNVPVATIAGLDNFSVPHPMSLNTRPANAAPCNGSATNGNYIGLDFRSAYVPGVTLTGTGQSVALVEFDKYYPSDISNYFAMVQGGLTNESVNVSNVIVQTITGPPGPGNDEVALDIEMAISMAPGLSNVYVYEAPNNTAYADSMFNRIASDDLALQVSSSWSGFPDDTTIQQDLLEFAAQGQSFFIADGDTGAYNSIKNTLVTPVDDPFLTAVGGTTLSTTGPRGTWLSETTWNWFPIDNPHGTSGGISPTFAIPIWQQGIDMSANQGSTNFRNIPDVSMIADGIQIIADNGQSESVGGTSVAAPLWAAFTALVNQQNAALSQLPIGFMNPALYNIARGPGYSNCFHDIITGNNTNYNSVGKFIATNGYDLCTGWGTPTGTNLLEALVQIGALNLSVQNGGFETGDFTDWTVVQDPGENTLVVSASQLASYIPTALQPDAVAYIHSGTYSAILGQPSSLATISQSLPTSPGQPYLISFWLANPGLLCNGEITPNEFKSSWNGTTLFDQTNMPPFGWTNFQFIVSGAATNGVIEFGAQNGFDFFSLDDVGVQAIPAPILETVSQTNGSIALTWTAQAGLKYQLEYTTQLPSTTWTNIGGPITATNGTITATDTLPPDPQRFYHLILLP